MRRVDGRDPARLLESCNAGGARGGVDGAGSRRRPQPAAAARGTTATWRALKAASACGRSVIGIVNGPSKSARSGIFVKSSPVLRRRGQMRFVEA